MEANMHSTSDLDLPAYLHRIGYAGDTTPSVALLEALHLAHATHIPFENLDILLKKPIRLDLESIQAKLVHGGRGGCCYENNLLFAAALRELGFAVTPLAGRVRYRTTTVLPRTHMLLLVESEGQRWLADVGFGSEALLLPVPLEAGREVRQFTWRYRLIHEAGFWLLQTLGGDGWLDMYAFTLEPQQAVDYEVASYYVSTHPNSRLAQTMLVQLALPEERRVLRGRELILDRAAGGTSQVPVADHQLLDVLRDRFGLELPAGTRFGDG
jgi:N-hydroxyarylamine O-acetyltransferase